MAALLHRPVLAEPPEELSVEQRRRLLATVTRAIERAARAGGATAQWLEETAGAGGDDASGVAGAPTAGARRASAAVGSTALPRPAARERVAPGDADGLTAAAGAAAAGIASADRPHLPTGDAPAASDDAAFGELQAGGDDELLTASGDLVVRGAFPSRVVLRTAGGEGDYVLAGGGPYVRSDNPARARAWGQALHGDEGYAVLAALEGEEGGEPPFYAVPLERALDAHEVGPLGEADAEGRLPVGGQGARLVSSTDVTTVMVGTRDGHELYERAPRAGVAWTFDDVQRAIEAVAPELAAVADDELREAGEALFDVPAPAAGAGPAQTEEDPAAVAETLAVLGRTTLAAVPRERREEFLRLLVDAWSGERERPAILELIHATRAAGELEAIFALLRRSGACRRLFEPLDRHVWELLLLLGEHAGAEAPSWERLDALLTEAGTSSAGAPRDPADAVELLPDPDRAREGLARLPELARTAARARDGDRAAAALLERVAASEPAVRVAQALAGLAWVEQAGAPAAARGRGEHVPEAVAARVRLALAAELAAAFADVEDDR